MPIVLDGSQGISTPMYGGAISSNAVTPVVGMKNRIINGACVIDQRNAGASVTVNGFTAYATDRFLLSFRPSTGTATGQQVSDAPAGFVNSLKLTQASVTSAASSDIYSVQQKIEGYNVADLNWGTANAKTITVSFWVKSSVTGTYGFTLQNINATRRSYVTTYTINSANTWEQKTVTIAGDTTGTWETTNSTGITLWWDLGSGSDYQTATLNAWQTANVFQATTGTRWIATSGATWQMTGVQLEVGSTATSFDYRPYGTELALCQRYCQVLEQNGFGIILSSANAGTTWAWWPLKTTMRASPSLTLQNSGAWSGTTPTIYAQPNIVGFYGATTNFYLGGGSGGAVVAVLAVEL
jgi:hypothetical protein